MEKFVIYGLRAESIPGYDCSVANRTREEWYAHGTVNRPLGYIFLSYGLSTQLLYGLIMTAMWKLTRTNRFYKIMLLLAACDVIELGVGSVLAGYFWLIGGVYCTHPNLNYIFGSVAVGNWCGVCLGCLILVINRLADLWDRNLQEQLFGGKRMWLWLSAPPIYSLLFAFFTSPVMFNSRMNTWFFSPFITGSLEELATYYNIYHATNNIGVVACTCSLYVVLIFVWRYKYGSQELSQSSKIQRSITLQSVLICSASLIASIMYVYMQYFVIPEWMILGSHCVWQASHGIPAYVYLAMNKTIRRSVLRMLGIEVKTSVHTLNNASAVTRDIIVKDPRISAI